MTYSLIEQILVEYSPSARHKDKIYGRSAAKQPQFSTPSISILLVLWLFSLHKAIVHFPTPWVWAGLEICFDQLNAEEMNVLILSLDLKRSCSPHLCLCLDNKPRVTWWRMRDHMEHSQVNQAKVTRPSNPQSTPPTNWRHTHEPIWNQWASPRLIELSLELTMQSLVK